MTQKSNGENDMEVELVNQLQNGHPEAYRNLEKYWQKRIYGFAYRIVQDHQAAEEVVQKCFIKVYQNIHGLQDASKFKSWLYRIAHNQCISEKRKQRSWNKYFEMPGELPSAADEHTPGRIYEKNEKARLLREAIGTLAQEQQQVIFLKEYEGLKFREIAEILDESESTVKSRLYYGLDNLRKIMLNSRWKNIYQNG